MTYSRSSSRRLLAQQRTTATPMSMSLDMLRKYGFDAYPVEVSNIVVPGFDHPFKKDLLGFADIFAMKDYVLLVQTTSSSNVSARVRKIQQCEAFEACKRAGVRVHVHGWGVGGLRLVDMTARDPDGSWTFRTELNIQRALRL